MNRYRGATVSLLFLLVLTPALFAQRPGQSRDRVPAPGTFPPRDYGTAYSLTEYGLPLDQAISGLQVVLTERRGDVRTAKEDVIGRAGRVVAQARTNDSGGVTFKNVPPGSYVVLIRMMFNPPKPQARYRDERVVLVASLSPYYEVKSFFESRSNIATRTAGANGLEWRTFPEGFVYAVRAPNLAMRAEELRRSRDETYNRETIIAQEFEIGGEAAVTVTAAIGRAQN